MSTPTPTPRSRPNARLPRRDSGDVQVTAWHALTAADVLARLGSAKGTGLDESVAAGRLEREGPNTLPDPEVTSPWRILAGQFTDTLVLLLLAAAAVSLALGERAEVIAILVIVVLNAGLGFMQEYRAERAVAALRQLAVPVVRVRRGGRTRELPASALVSGDVALLEAGNLVPADGRVIESAGLQLQEAALTGESWPVAKAAGILGSATPLAERLNMVYLGTAVSAGRGVMVVTGTGVRSELGRLAGALAAAVRPPTPLQRRLARLGRSLTFAALALVAVVYALGSLRGENPQTLLLTALALAVAVVPEGLPAMATITLALGARRMLRRRVLIRKLPAVETLGSVTVICSDKTGTLTQNRMTVSALDVAGHRLHVDTLLNGGAELGTELEKQPDACAGWGPGAERLGLPPAALPLLIAGALCSDAELGPLAAVPPTGPQAVGEPTEAALVVAAARFGLFQGGLRAALPRVDERPFDPGRRRMTTLHQAAGAWPQTWPLPPAPYLSLTKGAADSLLTVCTQVLTEDGIEPLTASWRERILAAHNRLAGRQMRVLGVACRLLEAVPADLEEDLIFVGLFGMLDPPRPDVREAIATCTAAGIRPVMITGDHPLTALEIARDLGIVGSGSPGDQVLTGAEIEDLSKEALAQHVATVSVYARVAPHHKTRIVRALQGRGELVAMTGDGVNDAPALKQADIGVAMGIGGTDVAKEAASMVLLDDNFSTIVRAVREGRVIFDNIRKFVKFALAGNLAEIWPLLVGPLMGMPLPLLPLQILWINLLTDGLPGLALGAERAEAGVMLRGPTPPDASLFGAGVGRHILWVGLLIGSVSLGVGYLYWRAGLDTWQTMVFATLTLSQMGHVLAVRSGRESLFRQGLASNPALGGAVALTTLLQLAVIYLPALQTVFQTRPLPAADLALALALSTAAFCAVELEKWMVRRRGARQ
ncbi:magnesium-transporting ATPase [Deinococcus aerolatus]|uniref:Magnesium-transporting ATPase n=1 Tax=Deinococcus aerolatus TaxID=522487 RepID=A0ABQ2GE26_9DEIO|nr:cation-translocating P-type ATPase [Deinococcus aerolatus]GGL90637.1 magnesium-transporting ATPase [Deinococcus aerolatus]